MSLPLGAGVLTVILVLSSSSVLAGQRHYDNDYRHPHHQNQNYSHDKHQSNSRVHITKEVTRDGVIIHKTITKPNGETYTIDKEVGKGRHGHVDIEKKRNGRVIHREHHQR